MRGGFERITGNQRVHIYMCIKLMPLRCAFARVSPRTSVSLIRAGLEPNIHTRIYIYIYYILLRFCHSIERVYAAAFTAKPLELV